MELTLRQARRLEREIEGLKQETLAKTECRQTAISIYQDFDAILKEKQDGIISAIATLVELTRIRFGIRKSIETDNEVSGLNVKMNMEATLKEELKVYDSLVHAELTEAEEQIAKRRHEAAVAAGARADEYGRTTDSTTLHSILGKDKHDLMKLQIKSIRKRLLGLVDEMTALNSTRTIQVSTEDMAKLEEFGIVV
jgi:23S rRNA maturation mini-RNase III